MNRHGFDRTPLPPVEVLVSLFYYDFRVSQLRCLKKVPRSSVKVGDIVGTVMRLGYRSITIKGKKYMAHRLIYKFITGLEPPLYLNHIDGNRDNNSIFNLEESSQADNDEKRELYRTTGLHSVSWYKRKGIPVPPEVRERFNRIERERRNKR